MTLPPRPRSSPDGVQSKIETIIASSDLNKTQPNASDAVKSIFAQLATLKTYLLNLTYSRQ